MSQTEPTEADQEDDVDDQDQPAIDEDEMADMSSIAEQVEQSAGAASEEDQEDSDGDRDVGADLDLEPSADRTSIGDIYCNVLGMSAAVARDRYGSGLEGDRKDVLDEYAEIARDLEIDQAVDDLIDEHGGPDSLTPGQTVIVMTVVWGGMVVMDDPEIIEGLAEGGSGR